MNVACWSAQVLARLCNWSRRHSSVLSWAMGNRNQQKVTQDMANTFRGCLESEQGLLQYFSSTPLGTQHVKPAAFAK